MVLEDMVEISPDAMILGFECTQSIGEKVVCTDKMLSVMVPCYRS